MKRVIKAFYILLSVIFVMPGALASDKTNKPVIKTVDNYIAVFDFEVTTGDKGISRPLTESVRREIVLSGQYDVIDRGNMNKILGEQKFQLSGCVAQECIVDAGQLLGVGKIISGTVSIVGKTYYLTLSLISVKTGKIENIAEDTCRCEVDELLGSTKRLAKKLLGEQVEQPTAAAESAARAKAEETERAKAEQIAKARAEAEAAARTEAAVRAKAEEAERAKAAQTAKARAEAEAAARVEAEARAKAEEAERIKAAQIAKARAEAEAAARTEA
ncbi:MAG: penicillin-binding protein activator LpoB, partial [Proteobacteria bacterium]|nr:penicillin-binding protein activator LpoB [Pseudomonadota bacterium]